MSRWERFVVWCARQRQHMDVTTVKWVNACRTFLQSSLARAVSPTFVEHVDAKLKHVSLAWHNSSTQKRLDMLFFKPVECANSIWLIYIVMAQTVGSYNNCACKSSTWGGHGGYGHKSSPST